MSFPPGWYDDGAGHRRWWDGVVWTEWVDRTPVAITDDRSPSEQSSSDVQLAAVSVDSIAAGKTPPPDRAKRGKLAMTVLLLGIPSFLVVAAIVVVVVAFSTAERWTKVDVPAHQETFHSEEYFTGAYDVTDSGVSPCYVGQAWFECRNLMVAEFNRECAGRQLTASSDQLCDAYGAEIDRMEEVDEYGLVVASVGGYGYLRSARETATREVSNNDYRPAITHEATCYLGFLGECR